MRISAAARELLVLLSGKPHTLDEFMGVMSKGRRRDSVLRTLDGLVAGSDFVLSEKVVRKEQEETQWVITPDGREYVRKRSRAKAFKRHNGK